MGRGLLLLSSFLSISMAHAGRYDAFEELCAANKGEINKAATFYVIPGERSNVGVATCALQTGYDLYKNSSYVNTSNLAVFDPGIFSQFEKTCNGKIYLSSLPMLNVSFGILSSEAVAYSYVVVVCY